MPAVGEGTAYTAFIEVVQRLAHGEAGDGGEESEGRLHFAWFKWQDGKDIELEAG